MRDYIFTFPNESTENQFLQMAHNEQVPIRWIALDPNSEYDGEHQLTSEDVWNALSSSIMDTLCDNLTDQENSPPWPRSPFEEWTQSSKRALIFLAVTEFACVGDRLPEPTSIIRAFKDGRLPNP